MKRASSRAVRPAEEPIPYRRTAPRPWRAYARAVKLLPHACDHVDFVDQPGVLPVDHDLGAAKLLQNAVRERRGPRAAAGEREREQGVHVIVLPLRYLEIRTVTALWIDLGDRRVDLAAGAACERRCCKNPEHRAGSTHSFTHDFQLWPQNALDRQRRRDPHAVDRRCVETCRSPTPSRLRVVAAQRVAVVGPRVRSESVTRRKPRRGCRGAQTWRIGFRSPATRAATWPSAVAPVRVA